VMSLETNGNLNATSLSLPATSANGGIIYLGGNTLVHTYGGAQNFFAGPGAGNLTCSGTANTGIGFQALLSLTSGNRNTGLGNGALQYNTTGTFNTGCGLAALALNTNGWENTAVGYVALGNNRSGSNNIALGYLAGQNIITGSDNICVGNTGVAGDGNTIRIGAGQNRTFIAGISGATAASGVAVYVNSSGQLGTLNSSARYKKDIQAMNDASEALYSLKPVTFHYKAEFDPQGVPQFGLVAEEVEKADSDLVARDDKGQIFTVRYEAVNAMLLNEFLKEHHKVEQQGAEIRTLREKAAKVDSLEKRLSLLEQMILSLVDRR